jgi:hypothetical protein
VTRGYGPNQYLPVDKVSVEDYHVVLRGWFDDIQQVTQIVELLMQLVFDSTR